MNIKNKVKFFLRDNFPKELYTSIFVVYQKIFGSKEFLDINKKYYSFTKRGVNNFDLEDIHFEIVLDPKNGCVDYDIYARGSFEAGILKLIRKELKNTDTFLDIGANIGQHSLYASHFCDNVISFEPIKKIFFQFVESISINDIYNIRVYNFGLGNQNGKFLIHSSDANIGASSLVTKSSNRNISQEVKIKKLDNIVSDLQIHKVDFMKIDVEGYEWEVLQGAEKLISIHKPKILIEFTPVIYKEKDNSIGEKIYDFLKSKNYIIIDVDNDGSKYKEVKNFEDIKDVFQTNLFCYQV
jgi:FkbM family methyltransferase